MTKRQISPTLPPESYRIALAADPEYAKDFRETIEAIKAIPDLPHRFSPATETSYLTTEWAGYQDNPAAKRREELQEAFCRRWALRTPIVPDGTPGVYSRANSQWVNGPVEVNRETRLFLPKHWGMQYETAPVGKTGLESMVLESDIIGGRAISVTIDLSHSWEKLQPELHAVIHAAQKLIGRADTRNKEIEFMNKVVEYARELKTISATKIADEIFSLKKGRMAAKERVAYNKERNKRIAQVNRAIEKAKKLGMLP